MSHSKDYFIVEDAERIIKEVLKRKTKFDYLNELYNVGSNANHISEYRRRDDNAPEIESFRRNYDCTVKTAKERLTYQYPSLPFDPEELEKKYGGFAKSSPVQLRRRIIEKATDEINKPHTLFETFKLGYVLYEAMEVRIRVKKGPKNIKKIRFISDLLESFDYSMEPVEYQILFDVFRKEYID